MSSKENERVDRLTIWLLGIIGVGIVFGGLAQFRTHLFEQERTVFAQARQELVDLQQEVLNSYSEDPFGGVFQEQQGLDTDEDGLSDFDESSIHNTSPYLADSDSDGTSDADEIAAGTNPNCPEGQPCEIERVDGDDVATAAESAFSDLQITSGGNGTIPSNDSNQFADLSTEELRDLLRQQGVTEEQLAEIDDETLRAVAAEAAQEVGGTAAAGADAVANIEAQVAALRNLSTEEKRNLLIESGADPSIVAELDEETLNNLVNEATDAAVKEVLEEGEASTTTTSTTP